MFKITNDIRFTHPVKVMVPVDGGHERQDFKATFKSVDPVEIDTFDINTTDGVTKFLRAVVVDLHDLVDDHGQPVPFSDDVLNKLLAFQFVRLPMVQAYFTAVQKAPEGN